LIAFEMSGGQPDTLLCFANGSMTRVGGNDVECDRSAGHVGGSGGRWHPQDGRITELGLQCQVDSDLGNDVLIAIAACPI